MASFPEIVEHHFRALSSFGFRVSKRGPYQVTFERSDVRVGLTFGHLGELGMTITKTNGREIVVSEVDGAEGRRFILVGPDNLEAFVARLAALLFGKYEPVLRGHLHQIEELAKLDDVQSRETSRGYAHGPALRAADEAWKQRDYAAVVRLLGGVEAKAWLHPPEARRLLYARKHAK